MDARQIMITGLVATSLGGGCSAVPTIESSPLEGSAWVLAELPNRPLLNGQAPTLRFESGRVLGSDGCNRYSAPVEVASAAIGVSGSGISTRMACAPAVMAQADAFMAALTGAKAYRLTRGALELLAGDGSPLARFAPQSEALADTAWQVTGINNGKQAVVSVVRDSAVSIAFGRDGQASGFAGCNRYTARYEAIGYGLRIGSPAATRKMCGDEQVMEQERAFLKALESVATMRREGNRLDLRDAGGALAVSLVLDGVP